MCACLFVEADKNLGSGGGGANEVDSKEWKKDKKKERGEEEVMPA